MHLPHKNQELTADGFPVRVEIANTVFSVLCTESSIYPVRTVCESKWAYRLRRRETVQSEH